MDALQVHALAAASEVDATGTFYDVAVGFDAAKGRTIRIFYDGEREAQHVLSNRTLNSVLIGQAVHVRGRWPLPESATKRQRVMEGEMATWVKSFRTRVLGDSQLGGEAVDLLMEPADVGIEVTSDTRYAVVDIEIVCDWDEYTLSP
jgi:hypothetical protein